MTSHRQPDAKPPSGPDRAGRRIVLLLPLAAAAFFLAAGSGIGEGPLEPPSTSSEIIGPLPPLNAGAPQPTMKTLHQLEPRTPIGTVPANISGPGSYYLTRDLVLQSGVRAINVGGDDVTIDLNGFSISTQVGGDGIVANVSENLVVRNGMLRGFDCGLRTDLQVEGARFQNLRFADCDAGMELSGHGMIVEDCAFSGMFGAARRGLRLIQGSTALVRRCRINVDGGDTGIHILNFDNVALFENQVHSENRSSIGISGAETVRIEGNALSNAGPGGIWPAISVDIPRTGLMIRDNVIAGGNAQGIEVGGDGCLVTGNVISCGQGNPGIRLSGQGSRVEGNQIETESDTDPAIDASALTASPNFIFDNVAVPGTYSLGTNNTHGTLVSPGPITTVDAWMNLKSN